MSALRKVRWRWIVGPTAGTPLCLTMPPPDAGGLFLFDQAALISAARIVGAKRIFEFGTFRGATTMALANNLPDAEIWTLDLPATGVPHHVDDREVSSRRFLLPIKNERVHHIYADSRKYLPELELIASMDLVLIDGGHDIQTLERDTWTACKLLVPGGVIAWHDYNQYPDVTRFLESLNLKSTRLTWVESTFLAFWFTGRSPDNL